MTADPSLDDVQSRVDRVIDENELVLFMKGSPARPRCGFSQRAAGLLRQYREDFTTVDVLEALPAYRAALEAHSGWETIPQVYADGTFIGGSDILVELHDRGELEEKLPE